MEYRASLLKIYTSFHKMDGSVILSKRCKKYHVFKNLRIAWKKK